MRKIREILQVMILSLLVLTSCKDNDTSTLPAGHGQVTFELVRNNVYLITRLGEIHTIKITLRDDQDNALVLPSMEITGTEDLISTAPYALPAGDYSVEHYVCFDRNGDIIDELEITLTKENTFTILPGETTAMALPVLVKHVNTTSNLYNSLWGLCMEAIGPDRSKWPPSWDFDGEGIDGNWAGLEFEWDVATNTPSELIGIVIDGNPEYIINSDTGEEILVSLPEFAHMRRLPSCIANFMSLDGITIRNCDMEELCPELQYSPITSLTVYNTKLKRVPEELGNMRNLCDVWLEDNELTEFPEAFTRCKDINAFVIRGEKITSVPQSISNWGRGLRSLEITGSNITELPDVFDRLWNVSTLVLDDNQLLSTLPSTLRLTEIPYDGDQPGSYSPTGITGLSLRGCAFTHVPAEIQRERLIYLDLSNNKLTSLSKSDFDAMPDLETLKLDGNHLTSFPTLTNPKLAYLSLVGCGLSADQIDITQLPALRSGYFFCK